MSKLTHETVPTVTPDTLQGVVFKVAGWPMMRGPAHDLFHINRLEDARQAIHFPMAPHRKTVNDFIMLTQGSMIRMKGLNRYEFGANACFFLPAHQISLDAWMSEDIRGYYCHFDTNLLTKRWQKQDLEREFSFLNFLGNPVVSIDNESVRQVEMILERLWTEYQKKRTDSGDIFRIYLLALFIELKQMAAADPQSVPAQTDSAAARFTQLYKNALNQFIYEKQQVAEYAELLNISPNHLNKCVKTATGQSARALLDEMLLMEAKVLLNQTDLTVSEIAYRIGKQDPSNFNRFFRNKIGMTPKEYQQVD